MFLKVSRLRLFQRPRPTLRREQACAVCQRRPDGFISVRGLREQVNHRAGPLAPGSVGLSPEGRLFGLGGPVISPAEAAFSGVPLPDTCRLRVRYRQPDCGVTGQRRGHILRHIVASATCGVAAMSTEDPSLSTAPAV